MPTSKETLQGVGREYRIPEMQHVPAGTETTCFSDVAQPAC